MDALYPPEEQNGLAFSKLRIFDISPSHKEFSQNVCKILGVQLGNVEVGKFRDGDTDLNINESVRGNDIFVFQSYVPPIGERLYELNQFIDAAHSGGYAKRVVAVLPFLFGSRGERRTRARQSVPALVVARNLKENGAWGVLTAGVHTRVNATIYNALNLGFENLDLEYLAANYIINHYQGKVAIASPDAGGAKRAERVINIVRQNSSIETNLVIGHKQRKKANEVDSFQLVGDVSGQDVFIVDDMGDTLGTIQKTVKTCVEEGAQSVKAFLHHPVLGSGFLEKMKSILHHEHVELLFGNTIPLKDLSALPAEQQLKVKQIPLEPFFAEAIRRMHEDISISGLHKYKKIMRVYEQVYDDELMGNTHTRFNVHLGRKRFL